MTDEDVERIVKMRFSPINISIHTMRPELRVKMMKNKRAGEVLSYLDEFYRAELNMCGQLVLCNGINDGEELIYSMNELFKYFPYMTSVSVVPAGLTKFRDKLYPLTDFSPEAAGEVIDTVNAFGDSIKERLGTRMFYVADEFYLKAGRPIPSADYYEDYPQIENGVGMLRSFSDEFGMGEEDVAELARAVKKRRVSIATGVASYPMISSLAERIMKITDKVEIVPYEIKNYFFGESITVSGLLTGKDIYGQLVGKELGDSLLIPRNALRSGEDVFLCGMTVAELEEGLGVSIRVCENDGFDFIDAIFGR
jgi:putative radical SAM enzyme (TIGR03279 family)